MATRKVAITVDEHMLKQVDRWVRERRYPNRSRAIQAAVEEKLRRDHRYRLAEEAGRLRRDEEQALAEEGIGDEIWPEY